MKLRLQVVRLNNGGYDENQCYWGSGRGTLPLYQYYSDDDMEIGDYLRASNRKEAKAIIVRTHPKARFYN